MTRGRWVHRVFMGAAILAGLWLFTIIFSLAREGLPLLTWHFLMTGPHDAAGGGIAPEIVNTVVMVGMALLMTLPLGLAVAIYQDEYRPAGTVITRELDRLRATFLSAPTVVVGLLVYRLAVGWWHWPTSILTGSLALAVINWPFMVTMAQISLRRVPLTFREASWALGATRFQTVVRVVFPAALAPLIEGLGLAAARLAGESAALIFTAGVNVSPHWGLWSPGETLAVHVWYIRTEGVMTHRNAEAAATGLTLMILIVALLWLSRRIARWFE